MQQAGTTSLIADERETIVNATDGDDTVYIWTAQKRYISKLKANPQVTFVQGGHYGTTEWAEFTVPADRWSPVGGVKRSRNMTDEQKAEAAARLAKAREARG